MIIKTLAENSPSILFQPPTRWREREGQKEKEEGCQPQAQGGGWNLRYAQETRGQEQAEDQEEEKEIELSLVCIDAQAHSPTLSPTHRAAPRPLATLHRRRSPLESQRRRAFCVRESRLVAPRPRYCSETAALGRHSLARPLTSRRCEP